MLEHTVKHLGVVKCFANYLPSTLTANAILTRCSTSATKRSMADMKAYTKALYEDQQILAEVVDAPHPMGDPAMECFPAAVYRLFQTDGLVAKFTAECEDYEEARGKFDAALRKALKEGFVGIKCHVLELCERAPHYVSPGEAELLFAKAKIGDPFAQEEIYHALFCHMLLMTQELDFPVHLHTGITASLPM
jgi:hypothetical protein